MSLWLVVLLAGVVTYAIRLSFIMAHGRVEMPSWFVRGLGFVPVAVLSALIFPDLVPSGGAAYPGPGNPRLLAGILAALVAWRSRSVWLTILAGMAVLLVLQRIP